MALMMIVYVVLSATAGVARILLARVKSCVVTRSSRPARRCEVSNDTDTYGYGCSGIRWPSNRVSLLSTAAQMSCR